MMKRTGSQRLVTALVGRTVHLVNDEEAREEAREQGRLTEKEIADLTVEQWIPGFSENKWKNLKGKKGKVVTVYLDKDGDVAYVIEFDGKLFELPAAFWRLE